MWIKLMRILVTAEGIAQSTGGARVGILGLCRGLARRGHQVTLIATNADGKTVLDVPLGVPTLQEGVEVYFYPVQISILGNLFSISMAAALKCHVAQSDIVLIHSIYRFTSTMAAYYCRKYNVPYILRPHGTLDPFLVYRRRRFLKWAYINLFERINFKFAAAIQYSCQMEEIVARSFIVTAAPSIVILEGIDLKEYATLPPRGILRARYPELVNKTLILFLGRFHQKKGLELLIDAFSLVASRYPNVHLVLAGSGDQDYTKHITQRLNDVELAHRSTITGQLDDDEKLAVLADADIFALSSHGENFGLAVVEAMACGLPVLISDKVGIGSDVAEYEAGIVTPCDPNQIADAMGMMVNDFGLRIMLGRNGKKLVKERFSIDIMAEKMEAEYQALCVND